MKEKIYWYGMKLRPFGIGCQPKEGFVRREDGNQYYHDLIGYNRRLTPDETYDYDLDFIVATEE